MGFKSHIFSTKEEMSEWIVLHIEDTFDQQELMFEGLTHFKEKGTYSIRPRVINLKLKATVKNERGEVLYLRDCYKDETKLWYSEKIVSYNYEPNVYCDQKMALWRWIKLQTSNDEMLDGVIHDLDDN
jgi:hypothetical protein